MDAVGSVRYGDTQEKLPRGRRRHTPNIAIRRRIAERNAEVRAALKQLPLHRRGSWRQSVVSQKGQAAGACPLFHLLATYFFARTASLTFACSRSVAALSVVSQVKSGSLRPK